LGYTADEIRGHTTLELGMWGDPADRDRLIRAFRKHGSLREFESSYRRKTGEVRPCLTWVEPITIHGEACLLGITQDVLARKQAEDLLRESEDRYRSLVAQSGDAILLTTPDGDILAANPAATRIFGWTEEELCALGRAGVVDPADPHLAAAVATRERTGQFKGELRFRRADGTTFPGDVSSAVFTDREGHRRTSMIIRDISTYKQIVEALQAANSQLHQSLVLLEQHAQEARLLSELGAALQSCFHLDAAYAAISRFLPQLFAGESVALCVSPASTAPLVPVVRWNTPLPVYESFAAHDCLALRQQEIYRAEGPAQDRCPHDPGPPEGATLCIPLPIQEDITGVLCLRSPEPTWSPARYERARTVGEYIRLALNNVALRAALRTQALHDSLTGLFNRRYMEAFLDQELARQERIQQPLAVIMIDLDHFKQVNDRFGHREGDRVLRQVGQLLLSHVRSGDLACRYGGEEFVLVQPNTSLDTAVQRVADLRAAFRQMAEIFALPEEPPTRPFTFSAGVAVTPLHGTIREALLQAADIALYQAKHAGRDRVVVSGAQL
jgi:diguanylate cyclase (GGDEF)-like protein/PAS domain S-box-containing protein